MALIGPHIQGYSEPSKKWARSAPIVKIMDDPGVFNDAPADALRIFRAYTGDNNRDVAYVLKTVDERLKGYRHPNLHVEPINEPLPWQLAETIAFFAQITPELHRRGLKVAGPSWSVGNPEPDAFAQWMRFAAGAGVDLLTFHAYFADSGFTPWAAGRPLRLIQAAGFTGPWAITEGGRDNLSTPAFNEGGRGGWKKDGVTADRYVRELFDFVALNSVHPGFKGLTPFTAAPASDWTAFDTDPLVDLILSGAGPTPPIPAPGPLPDQASLIAKYNLAGQIFETASVGVMFKERPNYEVGWDVWGPPDLEVCTYTTGDGKNRICGAGHSGQTFANTSDYFPENGQHGPWTAECGGARVTGLGMKPSHEHPDLTFYRKEQAPVPPDPPAGAPRGWQLAFDDYAQAHPYVGDAIGPIFYFPPDFACAGQESATYLLVFDGNQANPVAGVHEIRRA